MSLAIFNTTEILHSCSKQSLFQQKTLQHSSSISNFEKATIPAENPTIPAPTLFVFGPPPEGSQRSSTSLPTIAECAAHLELLEVFRNLRLEIVASTELDKALGIEPVPRTVYRKTYTSVGRYTRTAVQVRDETFEERRKEKWPFYLRLAAARFLRWVKIVEDSLEVLPSSLPNPPVDILMVWHALLLNPKWFRTFDRQALRNLPKLAFPWQAIHKCINSEEPRWPLKLPPEDDAWFRAKTGLHSNLRKALTHDIQPSKLADSLRTLGAKGLQSEAAGLNPQAIAELHLDTLSSAALEKSLIACLRDTGNHTVTKLVKAVQRQSSFVAKMDAQLWIRSPAVEGTLVRAISRYGQFLKLFKLYPRTVLVPTLDIDLVWHTHQCSATGYMAATQALAGRFIDHDDKLGAATLDSGMQRTMDLYRVRFAEEYQYCLCWDCEALRSAVDDQNLDAGVEGSIIARKVHEDVAYHRAVEISRQNRDKLLPIRSRNS